MSVKLYSDYKSQIRPLDLIAFKGGDAVSAFIRYLEKQTTGSGDYSHVGVVVTTDVLDHPRMIAGRLYLLESTATGFLGCGVKNIENKSFFGVQITDLDKLVSKYDRSSQTAIAVCHLRSRNFENGVVRERLNDFWRRYAGRSYQFNMLSMLAAVFPWARTWQKQAEKVLGGEDWVFCSELACIAYQEAGLLDKDIVHEYVVPADFTGGKDVENGDSDDTERIQLGIPSDFFNKPVTLLNKWKAKRQAITI